MRTEKSNGVRKSCIMGVVVVMIILQVILICGVISDIEHGNTNYSSNEVGVEDKESLSILDNNLLTQDSSIEMGFGKVTLIGILMIGTGYLLAIKERDPEERPEESSYIKREGDNKADNES